jgi:hypothetical protein
VLAACGGTASPTANTGTQLPTPTTATATATTQPPTPTPTPVQYYKVGQTVEVSSIWEITVSSAEVTTLSGYPGTYLIMDVKMKNISSSEDTVVEANWKVQDLQGQTYSEEGSVTGTLIGIEGGSKVKPGATLSGNLIYSGVPGSVHEYRLFYKEDLSVLDWGPFSADATWDIKAS